jgi:hemerythrin superfamily protein
MADDANELIKQDHREIERLFDQLDRHPSRRPLLKPTLIALLIAHDRAEEETVYPAARDAGAGDLVVRSQQDHLRAEDLLEKMTKVDADDAAFDTLLTQLSDVVTSHAKLEESEVLPALAERLDEKQRGALAGEFLRSRTKHYGELPPDRRMPVLRQQAYNAGLVGISDLAKSDLENLLYRMSAG